jgi:2'-5' RNA ligase
MTKRRVFLSISLPEKAKKRLTDYREKYDYLPVRWTKKDSLHFTLVFIGYVDNDQVLEICQALRELIKTAEPFTLSFKKIILGPDEKAPRMIWLEGEKNKELADLRNQIEDSLIETSPGLIRKDRKLFSPHITLARLKEISQKNLEGFEWEKIQEPLEFKLLVQTIELMESDLRSDGAEYVVLESFELGGED